ncbi:hypothetical protein HPB48_018370 [Haemaphysalis longicornis]|uniref:Peptidase M13 C-terminal domain-containing protein n=1 Tax=Haemaphysalis longicornis TaxID=44386 RepID=A0A9J6GCU8_HAELO|nr:hypothetical protein HPB48_018370 [Haemaphysalis longicornis]
MEQKKAASRISSTRRRRHKATTGAPAGASGKKPKTRTLQRRSRKREPESPDAGSCHSPRSPASSMSATPTGTATPVTMTTTVEKQQDAPVTSPGAAHRGVAVQSRYPAATHGSIDPRGSLPPRPSAASTSPPVTARGALLQCESPHWSTRPSATSSMAPSGVASPLRKSSVGSEASSRAPSFAGTDLLLHESYPAPKNLLFSRTPPAAQAHAYWFGEKKLLKAFFFFFNFENQDPANRTRRQRCVLLSLLVFLFVAIVAFVVIKIAWPSPQALVACPTYACRTYSERLRGSVNKSVNPCRSFTSFVCDGWRQHHQLSVWEEQFGGDVLGRLTTVLRAVHVPATGQNEEQQAAALYRSCREVLLGKSDQLPAVKEALLDAGIVWPRPSRLADALHTLFYTSLKLGWDALLHVDVKLFGEVAHLALSPGNSLPFLPIQYSCPEGESARQRNYMYFDFLKKSFRENDTSDGVSYENVSAYDCDMLTKIWKIDSYSDWSSYNITEIIPNGASDFETRCAKLSITFNLSLPTPLRFWITKTNFSRALFNLWLEHGEDTFHSFLSWCTVQVAALYSNRDLVLNYYDRDVRRAEVYYGAFCLSRAVFFSREAPFARYNNEVLHGRAETVAKELTLNLRKSFFRRLSMWKHFDEKINVLGNWTSLTTVFRGFERERENPGNGSASKHDMKSSSFASNWQNSVLVKTTAEVDRMLQAINSLSYSIYVRNEQDFQLLPYSLSFPLFDVELPPSVNYGGFGFEVAAAIGDRFLNSYLSASASRVKPMLNCLQEGPFGANDTARYYAASVLGLGALVDAYKRANYSSELPLPGFEQYTGLQTLFMAYCYTICEGGVHSDGDAVCNLALQYVPEFAEAFKCAPGDPLNPQKQCHLF